ncbi:MAG: PQQ-binding-like beta-propeller repeat protein, partial [Thaumarchaeota archaeon]|nr:PQQ-binding-like beta-propeller repeat protein [Nitrososphaerota archaeon]
MLSVSVIAILVFSTMFASISPTFTPPVKPAEAQAQDIPGKNWAYNAGNIFSTFHSPQTQITKENVKFLELKWMFPFPEPGFFAGLPRGRPGSSVTPLVIDGIIYTRTDDLALWAIDSRSGKTIWTYQVTDFNVAQAQKDLPVRLLGLSQHAHEISYYNGKIYIPYPDCQIHGIDISGKKVFELKKPHCADLEGNEGFYKGLQSVGPVFYEKGNILIYGGAVSESVDAGRGYFRAYDATTGEGPLWTFYIMPPQGQSNPTWTLDHAAKGWIQGKRATDYPREALLKDWHSDQTGIVGKKAFVLGKERALSAGVGIGWGQWVVDEETSIAYLATAQPSPDWNHTYMPGPNVMSNSVIALNAVTGELIWWHQVVPHDLWDFDCPWNSALGSVNIRGQTKKVVFKACKGAVVVALDAATGERIWLQKFKDYLIRYPDDMRAKLPAVKEPSWDYLVGEHPWDGAGIEVQAGIKIGGWRDPWLGYPQNVPNWRATAGGSETNVAFDGRNVYAANFNLWGLQSFLPVEPTQLDSSGRRALPSTVENGGRPLNGNVYSLDAATGEIKWAFTFGDGIRTCCTVTNGMLFVPGGNGVLYVLDADTGKVLFQKFHGAQIPTQPSIGADANGKMLVLFPFGAGGAVSFGRTTPGALMAYGLPDKIPEPQIITKEVIKEVP